ncbi:hypothetical protein Tco_0812254 [Tanacetum coccineum]
MLGRQVECLGGETDIVPLSYHIVDDFEIQFVRGEFCLVTGLKFGVDYSVDYKNEDDPISFRRRVFSSAKDGSLQFVLLGLEDRRKVPDWILRMQTLNIGIRYMPLSRKTLMILKRIRCLGLLGHLRYGYWSRSEQGRISIIDVKGVILEYEAAQIPRHVNRQNLSDVPSEFYREFEKQKRVVDQMMKKDDEREEMYDQMRKFMHDMNVGPGFPHDGPSSLPTQANNSFFKGAQVTPSYGHNMATPNWQTPMPSHLGTSNFLTQMPRDGTRREHGRMILESVEHGPLIWPTIKENGVTRTKKYDKLSATEKIQADCDLMATNIILQGLPFDINSLVNHHRVAKDLWERIQLVMQGTSLTKQEWECKLYDAFDKFAHINGESLHHLPPEWSKFVTDVKLVKDLHTINFDQLHAYLKQHELDANEVRIMRERNHDPLALVANHQQTPSHFNTYQSSYNNP